MKIKLFELSEYSRALLGGYLVTFMVLFISMLISQAAFSHEVLK